jgi:biopolymer transport protein TolR
VRWPAKEFAMGIAIGGGNRGVVSEPNIVPLIDVLLVLIIIFMVITPQVSMGLPTFVPRPSPPESQPQRDDPLLIVVQVMKNGKLFINRDQTDWQVLGQRLSAIFAQRANKIAFVQGAEEVPFEDVARAINIMRESGVEHVGFMTTSLSFQDQKAKGLP